MKFGRALVLRESEDNCLGWLCSILIVWQSENWSWEVINGDIKPDDPDEKLKEHYVIGNREARIIFMSIIDPTLFMWEFYGEATVISAPDIWKRIQKRFHDETGFFREQTIHSWLALEFDTSKNIEDNITAYKRLTSI